MACNSQIVAPFLAVSKLLFGDYIYIYTYDMNMRDEYLFREMGYYCFCQIQNTLLSE